MLIKSDGKALRRPVLSPDGSTLAVIAPDERIHLIDLSEAAQGRRFINGLKITNTTRPFIRSCTILRWSPEVVFAPEDEALEVLSNTTSECDFGKSWLLLSNGRRIIALSTELRSPKMMSNIDQETGAKSNILADYDLGEQLGKISLLEFVFDHRHALVMFEFGSSATILNLTRPQRDEIPHVKFPDARSFARAPDSRFFSLLRRDKGQDKITIFELGNNNEASYKSFDCNTSDAQNVTWCPTGQPLLAVWDSPTYGVKVSFTTAQGHTLRQFDISGSALQGLSNQVEGLGLTYWSWRKANQNNNTLTLQFLANAQKQVLVRYQSTNSMGTRTRTKLTHPESIDGSKTFAWLESSNATMDKTTEFTRQTGTFEIAETSPATNSKAQSQSTSDPHSKAQDPNQVDLIELNSTHTLVATQLRSSPRALFLWRPHHTTHPHTVLIFRHAIRQIHFHPYLPHVLIILTNSKNPRIYSWYQQNLPPIAGLIPIDTSRSTNFSGCWLPECVGGGDHRQSNDPSNPSNGRCPFLLTSNSAFEAGYLSSHEGEIVFNSILHRPPQRLGDMTLTTEGDESMTEVIDTPSRPSKHMQGENNNGVVKKARFDVPENAKADWMDDPIHEQAGSAYGYAW